MEQIKYDIFISYSRHDYKDENKNEIPGNVISVIKKKLEQCGISYWMDEEGNLTGKKFAHIIAGKIRESMAFLFVCSQNSVASRWVDRELSVADTLDKHIIPLICDNSYLDDKVIMFTSSLDRIEYFTNPEKELEKLISTIEKDKKELEMRMKEEEERILQIRKEEEERKKRLELEKKKEKAKSDINELITAFKLHSVQQEGILQQLYSKNLFIGYDSKQCPVCNNSVPLNKSFCEVCGWQFPMLYSLNENDSLICDEQQLALARTNWNSLKRIVDLQEDCQKLESIRKEFEDTKKDYEKKMCYQEKNIEDLSNQCQKQKEHINEKEEELASLQKSISSLSMQLDLSKQEVSQKEEQVQNDQSVILSLKERIESLTKSISQYEQSIQKKEEQIEKRIKEYKLLEDKYYQLIKGKTTTTIPKDTIIDKKTSNTAKEATVQNATPTLKKSKSIKSLDEAFSIIETCCNTSPIQDNYDFNRAKLSLNWLKNILGKKYGMYVSKNAILACKNIGELKQLLYNSSNRNGNQ